MSDTVGDIQNYLADFNPKDPVISKSEPVLAGGETGDESELDRITAGLVAGNNMASEKSAGHHHQHHHHHHTS